MGAEDTRSVRFVTLSALVSLVIVALFVPPMLVLRLWLPAALLMAVDLGIAGSLVLQARRQLSSVNRGNRGTAR